MIKDTSEIYKKDLQKFLTVSGEVVCPLESLFDFAKAAVIANQGSPAS